MTRHLFAPGIVLAVPATFGAPVTTAEGSTSTYYTDPACTVRADLMTELGYPIAAATLTVDGGRVPDFYGPENVLTLYTPGAAGIPNRLDADLLPQFAALKLSGGVKGDTGAPGADGINGVNGTDGLPGAPGTDGLQGVKGTDGLPGAPGADGLPGVKGDPGAEGLPGTSGSGLTLPDDLRPAGYAGWSIHPDKCNTSFNPSARRIHYWEVPVFETRIVTKLSVVGINNWGSPDLILDLALYNASGNRIAYMPDAQNVIRGTVSETLYTLTLPGTGLSVTAGESVWLAYCVKVGSSMSLSALTPPSVATLSVQHLGLKTAGKPLRACQDVSGTVLPASGAGFVFPYNSLVVLLGAFPFIGLS